MAKTRTVFACRDCGHISARWLGKCPSCGAWNTMAEEIDPGSLPASRAGLASLMTAEKPRPLPEIEASNAARVASGMRELDRVLGGGVVPGSALLIGGDPGIGKSTLLLQAAECLARQGLSVLYATGEESAYQVKLRAERLNCRSENVFVVAETNVDLIRRHIDDLRPGFVIVDSIQMVYSPDVPSAPGSVAQVRECASLLIHQAKTLGAPICLIGHVTKDGQLAGPRTLEHMVDTVLAFEGDRHQHYRLLRTVKNRFGPAGEIGVFEMAGAGLQEVADPSRLFLSEAAHGGPGAVICPALEGSRVLLVEVQALVAPSSMASPRRRVAGLEPNRAAMLLAALERRARLPLSQREVYLNVAGGVTVEEPGADLAACLAVVSSALERALPRTLAVMGEVGLGGEVRAVRMLEARLEEAARLGFERAIVPASPKGKKPRAPAGMTLTEVRHLAQALEVLDLYPAAMAKAIRPAAAPEGMEDET